MSWAKATLGYTQAIIIAFLYLNCELLVYGA